MGGTMELDLLHPSAGVGLLFYAGAVFAQPTVRRRRFNGAVSAL
jgi:hypothetical protein